MNSLKQKTYKYLLESGFSPVHKGFKFIIEAIDIIVGSEFKLQSLSEGVYKPLGKKHEIASFSVQKNIKNAIDYAGLNSNMDYFTKEFGCVISSSGSISCAAFLYFVADKIRFA